MDIKANFLALKDKLRSNLVEQMKNLETSTEPTAVVALKSLLAAFLVCLGCNFQQSLLIYIGLFISPFSELFFRFSIGVYQRNNSSTLDVIKKIILSSLVVLMFSMLYFWFTPYTYNGQLAKDYFPIKSYQYLAVFFLGTALDLFSYRDMKIVLGFINILLGWVLIMVLLGVNLIAAFDGEMIFQIILQYKLLFIAFFIGVFLLLSSLGIDKQPVEANRFRYIYPTIVGLSILFGLYIGVKEFSYQTTQYNVEQYLHTGLASKSFQVQNFIVDKSNKEVTVFYNGIRPASIQEESLKKQYHLSGYHFEYKEFK